MKPTMLAAILLTTLQSAHAAVFTDRAAFELAAGSIQIETFELAPLSGNASTGALTSIAFDHFTVTTQPDAAKVLDAPAFGAHNTTPGGRRYLYLDTDIGFQGNVASFIDFDRPIVAFGFDYTDISQSGVTPQVTIDGNAFPLPINATGPLFWGFVDSSPIGTIAIDSDNDSGYGIDDVTFSAAIPEPAAGIGLIASVLIFAVQRQRVDR